MTFHKHCIIRRGLAGLLMAACLLPVAIAPIAAIGTATAQEQIQTAAPTESITPSQWLGQLVGKVSDAEAAWLDHESPEEFRTSLTLTYRDGVSHSLVTFAQGGDGATVLTAQALEETDGHGSLTWIPVSATWKGKSYSLTQTNGGYTLTLPNVGTEGDTVTVRYEAVVSLSFADGERLINAAYQAALRANETRAAYESALAAYEKQEQAYAAYEEALSKYKAEMAGYQAYIQAMAAYESKKAAYEQYLADMENYQKAQRDYETYLAQKQQYEKDYETYMAYVNDPEGYKEMYLAYCQWLTDMETVDVQLAIIDSCFLYDAGSHHLVNTLNGDTVTTVINRKEELVSSGCNETDIDNADSATRALKNLLNDYPLRGSKTDKYAYYQANYHAIKSNFNLLYTSLKNLYGNNLVPDVLEMNGKLKRYWQFVGQLYVVSCLFDDAQRWTEQWTIGETTLKEAVDQCYLLKDMNSATPLNDVVFHMNEVKSPEQMRQPVEPTEVIKPVEPETVLRPTPPDEVRLPNPPVAVPRPDVTQRPVKPFFSHSLEALCVAVEAGELTKRSLNDKDISMTLEAQVEQVILPEGQTLVRFYAHDQRTLLSWHAAEGGGKVMLPEPPSRPADRANTYVFDGWVDQDGGKVDGDHLTVEKATVLYATYTATPVTYTVSWEVDGVTTDVQVPYGTVPAFEGSTAKAADTTSMYEFIGWSPAPAAVTKDVTYVAQYRTVPRTYTVTWQWDEEHVIRTDAYTYGQLPVFEGTPSPLANGRYLYTFKRWYPEIVPVAGDTVYRAEFEAEDMFPQMQEGAEVSLTETDNGFDVHYGSGDGSHVFDVGRVLAMAADRGKALTLRTDHVAVTLSVGTVSNLAAGDCQWVEIKHTRQGLEIQLMNAEQTVLPIESQVSVKISSSEGGSVRVYNADGELLASADNGAEASFLAKTGCSYVVQDGHRVVISVSEGGLCHPSATFVTAGTTVTLNVTANPGYACTGVQVVDVAGNAVDVVAWDNGSYHFTMPEGGVTVTPVFKALTYRVTFAVGAQTVSDGMYAWGATPTAPQDPCKESDENGNFVFKGWRNTATQTMGVLPVFEDATYEAVFEAIPLSDDVSVADTAMKLWEAALLAVAGVIVSASAVLVPFFVIRHRRQKH